MSGFDELWQAAVRALPGRSRATPAASQQLHDRLSGVTFPAAMALLALGQSRGPTPADDLLELVAREGSSTDGDRFRRALRRLLTTRGSPPKPVAATGSSTSLMQRALQAAGGIACPGVPVTAAEAAQVLELLRTGEFLGDVVQTTGAVARLTRQLPGALLHDIPRTPATLAGLGGALIQDGVGAVGHAGDTVRDLLDGRLGHPPQAMTHTLRWLYSNAGAAAVAETLRRIIAPDNQTARLALLIYARANGIPLTPEALDALHDGPLDTRHPDLGPALAAGVDALAALRGDRGMLALLGKLQR